MNRILIKQVCAALSEVLPTDIYTVGESPGMGYNGVYVEHKNGSSWYFSNTYGGDDGHTDYLRLYFTTPDGFCVDKDNPSAPLVDDDPIVIAKWVVGAVSTVYTSS